MIKGFYISRRGAVIWLAKWRHFSFPWETPVVQSERAGTGPAVRLCVKDTHSRNTLWLTCQIENGITLAGVGTASTTGLSVNFTSFRFFVLHASQVAWLHSDSPVSVTDVHVCYTWVFVHTVHAHIYNVFFNINIEFNILTSYYIIDI